MAPQDDLTAERAAKFLKQHFTELLRDDGEPWFGDVELIKDLIKTARQEALREAAKVAKAYIKARDDSRYMSESEDCERWKASYRVYADAADALDRLASEGG